MQRRPLFHRERQEIQVSRPGRRCGLAPEYWGKGIAKEAAEAIMRWAVNERGVKRFIAETERGNVQSARLLQKMGFVESGTDYWKEPSEVEWALDVKYLIELKG
ncbi:GNAT family N-acetyltransferase [Aspergillus melleus]|uniref:GNAT family N-acetyltransferase n=1 Tax=Aspergillus melleus TaxID=138277 RepID=UPI001E8DCE2B|nr:uncharacterized protein LDX57_004762 [Aspergillus melleus]KAH8427044.1 hypothetical protein LDX57_004762 [Aspergillus melleus]